jgi:hypothetical protein
MNREQKPTDGGGIEFVMHDSDGNKRRIILQPTTDGDIVITASGPSGEKQKKLDLSTTSG